MNPFKRFVSLLKKKYGLDPADVGIDTEEDYLSLAGDDTPGSVVAWLGRKYGLETLTEMSA
jgi:hypothetical protein